MLRFKLRHVSQLGRWGEGEDPYALPDPTSLLLGCFLTGTRDCAEVSPWWPPLPWTGPNHQEAPVEDVTRVRIDLVRYWATDEIELSVSVSGAKGQLWKRESVVSGRDAYGSLKLFERLRREIARRRLL